MKKFISVCISISLLISLAAPLQAKKKRSSRKKTSSSSTVVSCPVPLDKNEEEFVTNMLNNPSSSAWKSASNVKRITKWLNENPGCRQKYRGNVSRGSDTAGAACTAAFDNARKKMQRNPDICEAQKSLNNIMGFEYVTTERVWDGTKYVRVEPKKTEKGNGSSHGSGSSNKDSKGSSNGSGNGNRKDGTGTGGLDADKVEQKVDKAENDNKDNTLVLKFKHEVDTSFIMFGGKGELTEQEKEWIRMFNEANELNADLKGVLKKAVEMYVDPDPNSTQGIPAYVVQYLFMTYADLAASVNDMMPYVNYKPSCQTDRCAQIRSFASEAILMQVRFRDRFDENGLGSLVNKYLTPECEKILSKARQDEADEIVANAQGASIPGATTVSEAVKKCLWAKMRAYILVKGKRVAEQEMKQAMLKKLNDPKFKSQPAQKAFGPAVLILLASSANTSAGIVVTEETSAVAFSLWNAAVAEGGATLGAGTGAAGAAGTAATTATTATTVASASTVGEMSTAIGVGALAEVGAVATSAVVLVGMEVYGIYDAFKASYPNEARALQASLRSSIQSARHAQLQQQQQQQQAQQQNNDNKPKDDPRDEDKNKPRCQDEAKGRKTCQFRPGTTDQKNMQLNLLGTEARGGILFNLSDATTASRRQDLFECLQKAGLCPAGPVDFTQQHIFEGCDKVSSLQRKIVPAIAAAQASRALSPTEASRCIADLEGLAEAVKVTRAFTDDRGRALDHVQALYRGVWVPSVEIQIGLTDKRERVRIFSQLFLDNFDLNKLLNALSWELDDLVGYEGKNRVRRGAHERKLHGCAPGADGKFPSMQKWFDGRNLGSNCLHFHYEEWKTYDGKKPYVCNHALFYRPSDISADPPCKK